MTANITFDSINHTDCLIGIKRIPDASVDTIITDPPYFQGLTHNGQRGELIDLAVCRPFFETLFAEFVRVLKPDGKLYFFTDWRGYAFYYPLVTATIPARNLLVWNKLGGAGNMYNFQHELIIFASKKPCNIGSSNILAIAGFSGGAKRTNGTKVHPTQKPVEIIAKLITDSTPEGGVVLDCFAGSGTTAVACKLLNRRYICFELQEKYCTIARERVESVPAVPIS